MADIRLYGYSTSPFVRKVGCCLYYKQLPFEFVPVNPIDPREIAFTRQTQVPVLQIGDEWRKDSTSLAGWLDELFPERPLFGENEAERKKVLALDAWVTGSLIFSGFRSVSEAEMTAKLRHYAWRLAAIVSSQTPLSEEVRAAWPDYLKMAPFIQHMVVSGDTSETVSDMHARVARELIENFGGGPFFGGLEQPSLVDFAIYPQLVFNYMVGIEQDLMASFDPGLKQWLENMAPLLPENPLLVPDFMIVNSLPRSVDRAQGQKEKEAGGI